MFNKLIKFFASGFGVGYVPKAPGTLGSLWGVLIFWLCRDWAFIPYLILCIVVSGLSFYVAHHAEKAFGQKDAQIIVIDEIAGQMLAYLFIPFSLTTLIIGFILFRLFDIIKLFPANWAQDKWQGGFGVVGDDLFAGLQAGIVLYLLYYLDLALFSSAIF